MYWAIQRVSFAILLCGIAVSGSAQLQPTNADSSAAPGPAQSLYLKLRSVGLDKAHVYKIREASLDRAKVHFSLDDGTIAFTEAVDGHITGAIFEGYGEVLLMPPNQMERSSLSTFTGSAILEETFSSAYFRFNDDVFSELQPYLRPADNVADFVSRWDATARNLAAEDALRLFLTVSESSSDLKSLRAGAGDHMLHAYVQGNKFGSFYVRYDSFLKEQIVAGQHRNKNGEDYYDVWTSFSVPVAGNSSIDAGLADDEENSSALFDVDKVAIRAHIKPPKELQAKATLSLTAHQQTPRTLLFELSRLLRVSEVRADGKPVEFIHNQAIEGSHLAKRGNDVIAVVLPSGLQKNQKMEVSFDYSGEVISEAANGLLFVGEHGTWYPNLGFSMSSFELEFRYPAGWTLLASGHRKDKDKDKDSKLVGAEQISRWVTGRPIPVAGFNLGKYSETTSRVGKVTVNTYATATVERGFPGTTSLADSGPPVLPDPRRHGDPREFSSLPILRIPPSPPSPSNNVQIVGATSARAIEFYERYFGPYPYDELDITQMPGTMSQGWPGLIYLSSYSFLTAEEKTKVQSDAVRRLISDQVIAHETAHQWWGDLVKWTSYRDQWIMEGLANYSALMLLESREPAKFRQVMQTYRDDLLSKASNGMTLADAGPVTLGFRLSSSEFPGAYEPICYGRGTWIFHMLRTMMRDAQMKNGSSGRSGSLEDEPFVRALRKLRKDYEDKSVSTAELMRVFASELSQSLWYEGRQSLDWFNESWVNGNAIPSFSLRDLKYADRSGTTLVSGTIVQGQAPDTLVTAIPLYASTGGKLVFLKRVFAEGTETQFRISAPAGTRKIVIDPEHTLLARSK